VPCLSFISKIYASELQDSKIDVVRRTLVVKRRPFGLNWRSLSNISTLQEIQVIKIVMELIQNMLRPPQVIDPVYNGKVRGDQSESSSSKYA
jgi:hypothetical protein